MPQEPILILTAAAMTLIVTLLILIIRKRLSVRAAAIYVVCHLVFMCTPPLLKGAAFADVLHLVPYLLLGCAIGAIPAALLSLIIVAGRRTQP